MFPAHLTRVLEIVSAEQIPPTRRWTSCSDSRPGMDKQPIVVRRANAGYVLNRLQAAMLRECLALVEEGVADAASVDAGRRRRARAALARRGAARDGRRRRRQHVPGRRASALPGALDRERAPSDADASEPRARPVRL